MRSARLRAASLRAYATRAARVCSTAAERLARRPHRRTRPEHRHREQGAGRRALGVGGRARGLEPGWCWGALVLGLGLGRCTLACCTTLHTYCIYSAGVALLLLRHTAICYMGMGYGGNALCTILQAQARHGSLYGTAAAAAACTRSTHLHPHPLALALQSTKLHFSARRCAALFMYLFLWLPCLGARAASAALD